MNNDISTDCIGCVDVCDRINPSIIINDKEIQCPCRTCIVRVMCKEGIRTCEDIRSYASNFRNLFTKSENEIHDLVTTEYE